MSRQNNVSRFTTRYAGDTGKRRAVIKNFRNGSLEQYGEKAEGEGRMWNRYE
jgi:hypothetical protein